MTLFPGLAIFALALAGWRSARVPRRLRRAWRSARSPSRSSRSAFSSTPSPGCIRTAGCTSWCRAGRASACRAAAHAHDAVPGAARRRRCAGARCERARALGRARRGRRRRAGLPRDPRRGLGLRRPSDGPARAARPARRATARAVPADQSAADNRRYVLWSTDGFPRLLNGRGSFIPHQFERTSCAMTRTLPRRALGRLPARARRAQRHRAPRATARRTARCGARQRVRCEVWTSSERGAARSCSSSCGERTGERRSGSATSATASRPTSPATAMSTAPRRRAAAAGAAAASRTAPTPRPRAAPSVRRAQARRGRAS